MIKENLEEVEARITRACERSGRERSEVTLISVSKTKPAEMLQEAYDAGSRDFGENKPQEIREKYPQLPTDIRWHMIGHLQRNKIKYIIDKVCMIHSVDSIRLAEAIDEEAKKHGIIMPVLIEVNVAEEESKFGVHLDEAESLIRQISELSNIQVQGLMTIAPFTENAEDNRIYFRKLRNLYVDIKDKNIEEGATMVRVGTGIFGARSYSQI